MTCYKILFIAPKCYHIDSPEAIVNSKLVNTLREQGNIVTVISQMRQDKINCETLISNQDVKLIPVARGHSFMGICLHFLFFIRYGYYYRTIHWAWPALKACNAFLKKEKVDFILTRSHPSEVIGLILNKKYNIPWIVNWNDPYPLQNYPEPYGKGPFYKIPFFQRRIITQMAEHSSYMTFPCQRLQNYYQKFFPKIIHQKSHIIPHILDSKYAKIENKIRQKFILQYSGRLWYPRDPTIFLAALNNFIKDNNIKISELEIQFIGKQDSKLSEKIEKYEIHDYVKIIKPTSYIESLKCLNEVSMGLVIEAKLDEGIFFPSKVVDYFQMQKPILAISPEVGFLHDISLKFNSVIHANNQSVEAVQDKLTQIYSEWKNDPELSKYAVNEEIVVAYSSKTILAQYMTLFDNLS